MSSPGVIHSSTATLISEQRSTSLAPLTHLTHLTLLMPLMPLALFTHCIHVQIRIIRVISRLQRSFYCIDVTLPRRRNDSLIRMHAPKKHRPKFHPRFRRHSPIFLAFITTITAENEFHCQPNDSILPRCFSLFISLYLHFFISLYLHLSRSLCPVVVAALRFKAALK